MTEQNNSQSTCNTQSNNHYLCAMEVSKKARGGYRANAGTKSKYGEQTENITFRVPSSHKQAIREIVKKYLMNIIQQQHNDKVNDNTLRHRIGGNEAR